MLDTEKVIEYIEKIPFNPLLEGMGPQELEQNIFDSYEDIHSLYPKVIISERMIVKQMLYKLEGESNGYAMLKRQGVETQKINDASVTMSDNLLDPYVLFLINQQLQTKSVGHIGRLI
ncbi:hypothetical protein MTW84_00660 [Mammaliicoccus sciuri]|uniref:hypothetical protein n=1 Tax=Mammaliicoccus sciuri TaxID=1296 RepID=UPI001FB40670|nr:hypothetical protein [Mammaliicoccus sciuri]MCJ0907704.1 hypothetical protein [Mammaliicoccus sciuri]